MKFTFLALLLVDLASAFVTKPLVLSRTTSNIAARKQTTLNVFGNKKKKSEARAALAEDNGYWQGEWICADCGYIYDPDLFGGIFFEQQTKGFKCPQCSGPRRRYAKKVGDTVGVTLDGGDGPILAISFIGIVVTFALGFYFTFADI
eukprot:CAMPEP_0171639080 /NCGR_PEP_ID=MMETSP0990-20121206/29451_1 /TAXON_ID=483369 /ORGANISM="non described non described, Strain CCMP2098" /LENGTH=146 /DNA_ID=CAMNT_0012212651 /DNA_START=59 /DNA_END=499 /DNA_ORIENTATION=+